MRYTTRWAIPDHFPVGELAQLMTAIREQAACEMESQEDIPVALNVTWETTAMPSGEAALKYAFGEGEPDEYTEFDIADHIQELNANFCIHIECLMDAQAFLETIDTLEGLKELRKLIGGRRRAIQRERTIEFRQDVMVGDRVRITPDHSWWVGIEGTVRRIPRNSREHIEVEVDLPQQTVKYNGWNVRAIPAWALEKV